MLNIGNNMSLLFKKAWKRRTGLPGDRQAPDGRLDQIAKDQEALHNRLSSEHAGDRRAHERDCDRGELSGRPEPASARHAGEVQRDRVLAAGQAAVVRAGGAAQCQQVLDRRLHAVQLRGAHAERAVRRGGDCEQVLAQGLGDRKFRRAGGQRERGAEQCKALRECVGRTERRS